MSDISVISEKKINKKNLDSDDGFNSEKNMLREVLVLIGLATEIKGCFFIE